MQRRQTKSKALERPVTKPINPLYRHAFESKVPKHRVCRVSVVGIVILVLGRYFPLGYLDPQDVNLKTLAMHGWPLRGQAVRGPEAPKAVAVAEVSNEEARRTCSFFKGQGIEVPLIRKVSQMI